MAVKKKSVTKKKASVKKSTTAKRAVSKKAATKKAAPKRATAKKKVAAKAAAPVKAIREPMTKSALYAAISESTDVSKKDVAAVFDALGDIVNAHVKKRSAGSFTLPGLLKITAVKKPAKKARKNVPNPFRPGEFMDVAAKPATTVVKVRPLKKLKDFVNN